MCLFKRLMGEADGSMAIETAFVAPLLALLALGGFEVGNMVSRHHELQTAASEGETIALAAADGAEVQIGTIEGILATSLSLPEDQVTVTRHFRCNSDASIQPAPNPCDESDTVSSYIRIDISDNYTPVWTKFGVGGPVELSIDRLVQLS